jgi:hypothetical protein
MAHTGAKGVKPVPVQATGHGSLPAEMSEFIYCHYLLTTAGGTLKNTLNKPTLVHPKSRNSSYVQTHSTGASFKLYATELC